MPVLQTPPSHVIGCDVAKQSITLFDTATAITRTIANTPAAIRRWIATLAPACLVVCEPTGGHERLLLNGLVEAGHSCHRADTLRLKAFLRSLGTLAKTDAIDAQALARYGQERWTSLALFAPPEADRQALAELVSRRQHLIALKVAETNRLKGPGNAVLKQSCALMLRTLERELARIEAAIEAVLVRSQTLSHRVTVIEALPGVGRRTAMALAAFMPELGALSRRQAAALAGLAPHPRDSGTFRGYRRVRGGRPNIRASLFMAALAAARTNGPLGQFYKRLRANGKKPLVAIAALSRKIIVILNARLRDDQPQLS